MTNVQPTTAPVSTTRQQSYVPALDGIRGMAILGVLLFHTGHLSGGFLGVDLFFVLSGYLITELLLRETRTTGRVSLAAFWGRRVRRLMPALVTMLVTVTLLVWATAPSDLVRTTLADGPWVQANLVNWHLLAESASYWDQFGQDRVFEHLWSIAVEEQFYLVWPLLVMIISRFGRRMDRSVAAAAVLIAAVSMVLMMVLVTPEDPTRVYTGTDTRAFSLLLGAVVATVPARTVLRRITDRWAGVVMWLLVIVLGVGWATVEGTDSSWLFTGGLFVHSLASAVLIGLGAQRPHGTFPRTVAWRPLRWLGQVSYSLYLWHWPVIVLLSPEATGLNRWATTTLVCLVSIGLAALSKYLVEDPIRLGAAWARGPHGTVVFVAIMTGLAAMWLLVPGPEAPVVDISELD